MYNFSIRIITKNGFYSNCRIRFEVVDEIYSIRSAAASENDNVYGRGTIFFFAAQPLTNSLKIIFKKAKLPQWNTDYQNANWPKYRNQNDVQKPP